jgi:hypothetical protein
MNPDRMGWPPTRLDLFSLVAFGVVVYAGIERERVMVGVALFAALVGVVLPKLRGPFELSGPIRFKGELIDPQVPRLRGVVEPSPQRPGSDQTVPAQPQALPETKPPREG